VRFEIVALAEAPVLNARTLLLPLIVSALDPGPLMVRVLVIAGNALVRVIVPVTVNEIVLLPPARLACVMQ